MNDVSISRLTNTNHKVYVVTLFREVFVGDTEALVIVLGWEAIYTLPVLIP